MASRMAGKHGRPMRPVPYQKQKRCYIKIPGIIQSVTQITDLLLIIHVVDLKFNRLSKKVEANIMDFLADCDEKSVKAETICSQYQEFSVS